MPSGPLTFGLVRLSSSDADGREIPTVRGIDETVVAASAPWGAAHRTAPAVTAVTRLRNLHG